MFEKDRILTAFSFLASRRRGGSVFDENEYTVRGLENLIDSTLGKRQVWEKKDLFKAMKAEEERQKREGSFPDLESFGAMSLKHTRAGKDRALYIAQEDARSASPKPPKNQMIAAFTRASRSISFSNLSRS